VSRCNSCQAAIIWATTAKGKAMPLDVEPSASGNIELRSGIAHFVTPDQSALGPRYISHFATCVNARQHRKSR
jgi:hypothetical protein